MKRINHERPELKFRDNVKREMSRLSLEYTNTPDDLSVPTELRPLWNSTPAWNAFCRVLEEWAKYSEPDDRLISFNVSEDALELREACRKLVKTRMPTRYDRLFSTLDWMKEGRNNPIVAIVLQLVLSAIVLDEQEQRTVGSWAR